MLFPMASSSGYLHSPVHLMLAENIVCWVAGVTQGLSFQTTSNAKYFKFCWRRPKKVIRKTLW